ncbi:MAG TPA: phosphoglucomutase/phosphomannomutase family protein [Candidatus Dormibacteraeota bacterium]
MGAPPQIKFGTDGWRGVIGDDFTYETLRYAAQGVADYLTAKGPDQLAVVGYDCRFASEIFAEEVARVLAGNRVRSLLFDRPSPTQVASWTVIDRQAAGAAVVTASHNPYIFNGLKYKPETGSSAPPEVIAELERRINAIAAGGPGGVQRAAADDPLIRRYDPRPAYYAQIAKMIDLDPIRVGALRILHEVMYGSGYGYVEELLAGGSTTVIELHSKRNPFFGGVNPEPIPDNLDEALQTMKSGGYDLCICTDGDADRVGIIDGSGRFVNQLQVYALLMVYLVEMRGWKGPVVRSVNMTHMADELGRQYGVPVYEVPVGFKNVAPKMMETGAVLGGEESGGFAIRGHIPERDGILAGLCFADMMVRSGRTVSQLLEDLEAKVGPHAYARHDIHLPRDSYEQDRKRILETLREKQPRTVAGVAVERVRDDDGFKFFLKDGSWVLLRTSGTEPLIRVYAEARDADAVAKRLAELEAVVGLGGHDGG